MTKQDVLKQYIKPFLEGGNIVINGMIIPAPDNKSAKRIIKIVSTDRFTAEGFTHGYGDLWRKEHPDSTWPSDKADQLSAAVFTYGSDVTDTLFSEEPDMTSKPDMISHPDNTVANFDDRKIFLIHGHDQGQLHHFARFITHIGLKPIILNEQANKGKTIIEKFEANSDVGYAVALFTGDDVAGKKGTAFDDLKPRARQNVVFELGYMMAKLGRGRVSAILADGIEEPSDIQGVVYIPMDSPGHWHVALARELRAVKIAFDSDKLLEPMG